MNMKAFRIRVMAAVVAVLLGTMMAKAQSADTTTTAPSTSTTATHHGMHHRHGFRYAGYNRGFFAKYLNLTDAQKTQMKSIMQKEHETMKPLMQQMHETHQQLHQIEEGTYDDAKVRNLAAQQSQTQAELTVEQTKLHNELFQVLTPEQQTKMKQMEATRAARWQARRSQSSTGSTTGTTAPATTPEQQ
jgi:periplasmic protein CpxP/Spy